LTQSAECPHRPLSFLTLDLKLPQHIKVVCACGSPSIFYLIVSSLVHHCISEFSFRKSNYPDIKLLSARYVINVLRGVSCTLICVSEIPFQESPRLIFLRISRTLARPTKINKAQHNSVACLRDDYRKKVRYVDRVELLSHKFNHSEGRWPKD
jgi:hypothetical protein